MAPINGSLQTVLEMPALVGDSLHCVSGPGMDEKRPQASGRALAFWCFSALPVPWLPLSPGDCSAWFVILRLCLVFIDEIFFEISFYELYLAILNREAMGSKMDS